MTAEYELHRSTGVRVPSMGSTPSCYLVGVPASTRPFLTLPDMLYSLWDMARPPLGELELVVLFVAMDLRDDAYGAEIRRVVSERTGRDYSVGAIYASLQRLEEKGLVRSFESDPLPVRGGRSRRYFVPTATGRAALRKAVAARRRLWGKLTVGWQA